MTGWSFQTGEDLGRLTENSERLVVERTMDEREGEDKNVQQPKPV